MDSLLASSRPLWAWLAIWATGFGLPLPEDPLLLAAGALTHRGYMPFPLGLALTYLSQLGADCTLFLLARHFRLRLTSSYLFNRMLTRARRERVERLFRRHGSRFVLVGRHVWGLKPVVFVLAGMHRLPLRTFLFWDALGVLFNLPLVFSLGYLFSNHLQKVERGLATAEHWLMAGVGVAALVVLLFVRRSRLRSGSN